MTSSPTPASQAPPSPPSAPFNNALPSPQLTASEREALFHWSLHGQGHDSSLQALKPRTAPPRRQKPISKPVSAAWNVPLSPAQMVNLKRGFQPQEMEDKWFIYSRDGDGEENGGDAGTGKGDEESDSESDSDSETEVGMDDNFNPQKEVQKASEKTTPEIMRLFMVRSWTGNLVYILRILVLRDESRSGGKKGEGEMEGRILGVTWETDEKHVRGQDESVAKETAREVCRWILGVQLLPDVPAPRRGKVGQGQKEGSEVEIS